MEAEIAAIKPEVLVCLGATAARAIVAAIFRCSEELAFFRAGSRHRLTEEDDRHASSLRRRCAEDEIAAGRLYGMLSRTSGCRGPSVPAMRHERKTR